jgi:DNA-directed RNA polymerase subunit RPC12/RpoP
MVITATINAVKCTECHAEYIIRELENKRYWLFCPECRSTVVVQGFWQEIAQELSIQTR